MLNIYSGANRVLIFYPRLFNCFPKFERKVLRVLSGLDGYSIVIPCDYNCFVKKLCSDRLQGVKFSENPKWDSANITHAIVFDDGEDFFGERSLLEDRGIPLRYIKVKITRVVNVKQDQKFNGRDNTSVYEYIGRGSKWGNPYSIFAGGDDRDEVIRKFKYDFDFDKFPHLKRDEVYSLAGKRLGCFCKPASCHGDVLADFLNSWDDGK
ncbi:DUF4326 domain-containing protein [Microbulbifer sp. ZKSA006]|uniref:DUF4326 domain-containing protein n=1 Tax=Microbulbifer sp. ZKSA006 TaxID=3243390 RepID=UPI004039DB65